jgi:hypothetical protein
MDLIIDSPSSPTASSFPDNPCLDWICPALLILDVMTQPVLLDKENILETLREIRLHEENTKYQEVPPPPIITPQIKTYLAQRFGLKPKDFEKSKENSSGTNSSSSSSSSSLQFLPLEIENGLTPELSLRTLDFSIRLMRSLKSNSKRASGVYQALMQLIVHLTRAPELRKHLLEIISIHEIIHLCAQFEGSSFFLFSLILHITEDPESLAKSMQSVMRFCIQRISKTESSTTGALKRQDHLVPSAITLESFLGILTPLLYRNEEVFLAVFKAHMRVFEHGRVLMVGLKDASQEVSNEHKTEGHVQMIVDEVLMLIMLQWIRITSLQQDEILIGCNRRSSPPSIDSFASGLKLPLSDLLILLADLITSVPGLATCIHKFQLPHALERFAPEMHPVLKFCLSDMKHVVTGDPLHSSSFITFLVHYLLVSQHTVPHTASPSSTTNHGSDPEGKVEEGDQKRKEMLTSVLGKSMTDSPAYLVAALLARPGDGRRRTMKELLNALKIHDHPVDTTEKLKAVSILAATFQKYQTVNPAWRRSEMLVVPTKELLEMMSFQKAYQTFSDVLCGIRLDHPLAQQISLDLAVPLEILIRKGISDCPPATESAPTPAVHQRKRIAPVDTSSSSSQNPPLEEFHASTSTDLSQPPTTPSAPPRSEQIQLNSDLPIEVSMSDYIPRSDDQELDQVMYQSDDGEEEEEEEEEEVEDDDEEDDDEDDEDDDVDDDEDDDDQDDDPGVSFYADEEDEAEMSSEDEESNQNMNGEFVQVPAQDEHRGEDHDHDGNEGEEDDEAHAEDVVDQILSVLSNGGGTEGGHGDEDDEEDDEDDENPEDGAGDVEQEIFLNGEMENPELESELRRMASSPAEYDDGDDDDPTGGLDAGYLVNHLEDDDEGNIE